MLNSHTHIQIHTSLSYLTYKAPRCNALILIGGRGYRPDRRRRRYSTFAPFPDTPPVTSPRLGQTKERCMRRLFSWEGQVSGEQMSGHVMLTVGCDLWTTATAAVGLQYWAKQGVCVTGSRLKSTKLLELYRIVPADSLPRPPPPAM